jgi:mannose-6-phosphate isomerase-like protein (cupin superfamily)
LIECWVANEIEAGYCAKYLFLFDGQACPNHYHQTKVETFFIVKGKVRMECAGSVCEMMPGDVLLVEAEKPHTFSGLGPALILEVSTPCIINDNFFENKSIPIGGNYGGGAKR